MKYIVSILLAASLAGCVSEEQIAFDRKVECAKYLQEAEKKVAELSAVGQTIVVITELEKMFYTTTVNSCVYLWTTTNVNLQTDHMLEIRRLTDALTGEELISSGPMIIGTEEASVRSTAFEDELATYLSE